MGTRELGQAVAPGAYSFELGGARSSPRRMARSSQVDLDDLSDRLLSDKVTVRKVGQAQSSQASTFGLVTRYRQS